MDITPIVTSLLSSSLTSNIPLIISLRVFPFQFLWRDELYQSSKAVTT